MKRTAYSISISGLMLALGLIVPLFTSHAFGLPGTVLLPMHLPVLLCGLLCGPLYGGVCGLLTPILSSLLTQMPPVYPMLPIMLVQLVVLGAVSGLLYRKLKLHIYLSIPAAVLCGWAGYAAVFQVLLLNNPQLKALSVSAAVVTGLPGLALELLLCPAIVVAVNRATRRPAAVAEPAALSPVVQQACDLILGGKVSCVVIQGDAIVHQADGRGVSPLLRLYQENPALLRDAVVVDKIIGKAAAMVLVLGGARQVHGLIMSVAARAYLQSRNVPASYGRCVDVITARSGSGICPIEQSVLALDDPQEGLAAITATLQKLHQVG